jgi:hypothetical protein
MPGIEDRVKKFLTTWGSGGPENCQRSLKKRLENVARFTLQASEVAWELVREEWIFLRSEKI